MVANNSILHNIFLCVPQKRQEQTGLEGHESERVRLETGLALTSAAWAMVRSSS